MTTKYTLISRRQRDVQYYELFISRLGLSFLGYPAASVPFDVGGCTSVVGSSTHRRSAAGDDDDGDV